MTLIHSKCRYKDSQHSKFYYYEPIQINVVQSGNYTLSSVDSFNIIERLYGYLYKEHFNEFIFDQQLIAVNSDDDLCPNEELKIITELQSSVTYILIMTPRYSSPTDILTMTPRYSSPIDDISILVSGPNNITFNVISKSNIESTISSFH